MPCRYRSTTRDETKSGAVDNNAKTNKKKRTTTGTHGDVSNDAVAALAVDALDLHHTAVDVILCGTGVEEHVGRLPRSERPTERIRVKLLCARHVGSRDLQLRGKGRGQKREKMTNGVATAKQHELPNHKQKAYVQMADCTVLHRHARRRLQIMINDKQTETHIRG